MYGEFAFVFLLFLALAIANAFSTLWLGIDEDFMDLLTNLPKALIFVYYGFYGNLLYVRRASVRVNNITAIADLKKREKILKTTGGTGPWGFIVALLWLMLLAMRTAWGPTAF